MEWILKLPPKVLSDLLKKSANELNAVEEALRETLQGIYTKDELEKMGDAAGLDDELSKKPVQVGVVKRVKL